MKKILALLGVAVALIAFSIYLSIGSSSITLGNIKAGTTSTHSSSTLSGTAAVIFSTSTDAQYRSVSNRSTVNVWLGCNTSTGFTAGTGRLLSTSSTIVMEEAAGTMWCTDTLYGITDGGAAIVGTEQR